MVAGVAEPLQGKVGKDKRVAPNLGFAWLRLIAAALVILNHSAGLAEYRGATIFPSDWHLYPGHVALSLVFAMSGYQISGSWQRDPCWWRFCARRLLRLLPPLFVIAAVTALVVGPLVTSWSQADYWSHSQTWRYLVGTSVILLLQHRLPGVFESNPYPYTMNGSIWTLPMELVAYLVVLAVGLLVALRLPRIVVLVPVVAGAILLDATFHDDPDAIGSVLAVPLGSLFTYMVPFTLGMLMQALRHRIPLNPLAALVLFAAWVLLRTSPVEHFLLPIAAAYGTVAIAHHWPAWLSRTGHWVAGSYGMYLWGFLIQQLIAMAGVRDPWLLAVLAIPLAYVFGLLSWNLVEKPTQRWRKYLRAPASSASQTTLAVDRS
jgi:peptidoglycan/LPS O-acetylase OafA/YrhL